MWLALCAGTSEVFCVQRSLFIYLSCKQKTNSKMSTMKQLWHSTAAGTTNMNHSASLLTEGPRGLQSDARDAATRAQSASEHRGERAGL